MRKKIKQITDPLRQGHFYIFILGLFLGMCLVIIVLRPVLAGHHNIRAEQSLTSWFLQSDLSASILSFSTPTPFQPLTPEVTTLPVVPKLTVVPVELQPTDISEPKPEDWQPSFSFYGIDFSIHERVTIKIIPPNDIVNNGKPIKISFIPGEICNFGDNKACVYAYKPTLQGNTIFLSIHSGVGGEGQGYRDAVEGTFINSSAYSLDRIHENMQNLSGAKVSIWQGELQVNDLGLVAASRIPAQALHRYFKRPMYESLATAANLDPNLEPVVEPAQPQIVFETCGWKNREEPWAQDVSATTASIYLAVIQQTQ